MTGDCGSKRREFLLKNTFRGFCILMIFVNLIYFTSAYGAEYPTNTIQVICPMPPGGEMDLVSRLVGKKVSTLLGQQVVVINKSSGSGTAGYQFVSAAPADGYTILMGAPSMLIGPLTRKDLPFSFKDFTPVNLAASEPVIISVKKDAPWKTLQDLIAEAKKEPGKLSYSTSGAGTLPHLAGEYFKITTGTSITHIPMDGSPRAISAVLGGHTHMVYGAYAASILNQIEAGKLRALAVMSRKRLEKLPDVPTTVEMGYPKLTCTNWQAFLVRSRTSPAIIRKLGEVFHEALEDKEVIELFKKAELLIENLNPADSAIFLGLEEERLADVVKASKIGLSK